ncbi:MAG: hypothetical protein R2684_13180 [Pyrinomonadaceae bacterium]
MPKHLLPSLKSGHNVTNINSVGEWQRRDAIELYKISSGLDVNQATIKVNSIPDVWARPLLFEMALADSSHPLHEEIKGEWRGLLAMIALKDVKNIQALTARVLRLEPQQGQVCKFRDALVKLLPQKSLCPNTSWRNNFLFLYHDGIVNKPIGMTSPTTLVCTSTSYSNSISNITWFDGILRDPTKDLSPQEKKLLAGWLEILKANLLQVESEEIKLLNRVSTLIDEFMTDLRISPENVSFSNVGFGFEGVQAGIFIHLDKPVKAPQVDPEASHVRILPSPDRTPQKHLLLVDEKIAEQWHVEKQEVTVFGAVSLASLPYEGVRGPSEQFGGYNLVGAQLIAPNDLFTEKLLVVRVKDAFPNTANLSQVWQNYEPKLDTQPISVVLPFRKFIFDYLDRDSLLENLDLTQDAEGAITINLTLKLSGKEDGKGRDYVIRKKYSRADFEPINQIPILEIFPKFKTANWNAYFLAYEAQNPNNTFRVSTLATVTKTLEIRPLAGGPARKEISLLKEYPEFVFCEFEGKDSGVLVLDQPETVPNLQTSYNVGVDFGASGTCVYAREGNNEFRVTFKNQKRSFTEVTDLQSVGVLDLFLPTGEVQSPFLTIYQDFGNSDGNNYQSLLNGHIYYYNTKATADFNRDDIKADLKWSSDSQLKLYVRAFLSQICLQTTAELVAKGGSNINWRFSFPTAFSRSQVMTFSNIWNQVVKDCHKFAFGEAVPPSEPKQYSESVVSAQYFRDKQGAAVTLGVVFIDIGSSTSDISIWQANTLKWQVSLRWAGRHIFLDYLLTNENVCRALGIELDPMPKEKFYATIDSILANESDRIFDDLSIKSDEPEIIALKRHLATGLAGLFFYLGLCLKQLVKQDKYKSEIPQVYIGGNGSKMFRWLSNGGEFDSSNPYDKLFRHCFKEGLGDPSLHGDWRINASSSPKNEAAIGLVTDHELSPYEENVVGVIAGDSFTVAGEFHEWDQLITPEQFEQSIGPSTKLEKLSDFVEAFNSFVIREQICVQLELKKRDWEDIRSRVSNELSDQQPTGDVKLEPIFVLELKHLLNQI